MAKKHSRKRIEKVVAIIYKDGKILVTQKAEETEKSRWDFPSGEIEKGETPSEALVRQLHEKLGVKIDTQELVEIDEYSNSKIHLTTHFFLCTVKSDLKECEDVKWFSEDELEDIEYLSLDEDIMDTIKVAIDRISKNDKNSDINSNAIELKKYYKIFKDNMPQITALLSGFVIIVNFVVELFLYVYNKGFYDYYGVIDSFSLAINKFTLNRFIILLAVGVIYVLYSVFAVRMWLIRKNFFWKIFLWLFIPLLSSILLLLYVNKNTNFSISIFIAAILFVFIQWIYMWFIGYWEMDPRSFDDILGNKSKKKKKNKLFLKWRDIDYKLVAVMMIIFIFIIEGGLFYNEQKTTAKNKLEYGIVNNNDETYAFLGSDGEKIVLLKCEINQNEVVLYKGNFMIVDIDGVEISMRQFSKASLVQSTSESQDRLE